MKNRLLAMTFVLALPFTTQATAHDREFDQAAIDACTIEGTEDWLAREAAPSAAEQEILDLETLLCRMFAVREIDELADEFLSQEGIILLDGAGIADGRDAQRGLFKYFVSQGFDLSWQPVKARVSSSGDMAWAVGTVKVTYPDGKIEYAKYTSVWQKFDGKWQNVVEMRNGNGELGSKLF